MTQNFRHGYWLATLAALGVAIMMALWASPAVAEGNYVLDKATYRQIHNLQELMGKEKYQKVRTQALDMLPSMKDESEYAEALVLRLVAQTYLLQNNYSAAERYLEQIVQLDALRPRAQRNMVYQLATIYLTEKKYDESIQLYKSVIHQAKKKNKGVKASLYYYLGIAYSYSEEYPQAYKYIHKAIVMRENAKPTVNKKGEKVPPKPVPKGWYQNLFIAVYKQEKFEKANDIAKMLVAKYPTDKQFWNYYANTYLLLKEDEKAASVYALMYKRGMLDSKAEYMQLVSLLIQEGAPYKAANILQKAMEKGIVPTTADNYSMLAAAWMQAKEWDEALAALGKQAQMEPSGEVYLRQASIYMSRLQYNRAVQAARNAIQKGGLDDPGLAWMILGQAAFRADQIQTALDAFHKAADFAAHEKSAKGWITYVHKANSG